MPRADDQDTFVAVLDAIDKGETDPDRHLSIQIDRSLRDAIIATQSSGQPASVTLTLKVRKESTDRRVAFSATVNAKLSRPPVSGVVLYADDDGTIHRSNPDQFKLDLSARELGRQLIEGKE